MERLYSTRLKEYTPGMNKETGTKEALLAEIDKDSFRKGLTRFTWQAYNIIPPINTPLILDIGCGTGIPTIDLAILCKGKITALDSDRKALQKLKMKIKGLYLTEYIKPVHGSLFKLKFKKNYFDIIWTEGTISVIGFENGLKEWHKFIKSGGYLVVHDGIKEYQSNIRKIPSLHYTLHHHFIISEHVWYDSYFKPLGKRIHDLKQTYKRKPELLQLLEEESFEIEQFKKSPGDFASIFYIMKKE